ncbi:MAG: ABC transporter permease [Oscillibacter sp.]|jgi:peptide/nickel transport system permease protein|nr:ABC transporter permease [Oscillibacter sp.]
MYKFVLKRLVMLIPVLLGVSFIVFSILSFTPGDPVEMRLGDNYSEEAYQAMKEEMGLNDPFLLRYVKYIGNAVRGDFGNSYRTSQPVLNELAARLPNTILLSAAAMLFAVLLGIPLGVISATHQYSAVDNISMIGALFGVSMPNFWLGLMLIVIFAAGLRWFPSSGFEDWASIVLPAVTLSVNSLAMITRMTRSSMLETIRQDYIRTARAKGLKEGVIVIKHALRNAMIPIVTTVGLQFGFSLGGAVLVETVFAWPGIGRLLVECIKLKDTPVVVACVLVLATMFTVINLCIDILYAFLDPRIRAQYKTAKG